MFRKRELTKEEERKRLYAYCQEHGNIIPFLVKGDKIIYFENEGVKMEYSYKVIVNIRTGKVKRTKTKFTFLGDVNRIGGQKMKNETVYLYTLEEAEKELKTRKSRIRERKKDRFLEKIKKICFSIVLVLFGIIGAFYTGEGAIILISFFIGGLIIFCPTLDESMKQYKIRGKKSIYFQEDLMEMYEDYNGTEKGFYKWLDKALETGKLEEVTE